MRFNRTPLVLQRRLFAEGDFHEPFEPGNLPVNGAEKLGLSRASTALTEWFQRVREYMPSVEHYALPDQIRLGEPFVIPGRAITKAIELS